MKAWRWRLAVLFLTGIIFLPGLTKRHFVVVPQRPCFLGYAAGYVIVRVVELGGAQAIYRFSDGTTVLDVKNMTCGDTVLEPSTRAVLSRRLKNGDVVEFTGEVAGISGITMGNMPVAERIVLGIPLDPDTMTLCDWMALPGVGRSLAEAIVADRHKNGVFRSFERISRVPGIGPGRITALRRYFQAM